LNGEKLTLIKLILCYVDIGKSLFIQVVTILTDFFNFDNNLSQILYVFSIRIAE